MKTWEPGLVNTNWEPGPVNTNWGPGPGAGAGAEGRGPSKEPGDREIQRACSSPIRNSLVNDFHDI